MRSLKLTMVLCGLMVLLTPTRALAWWELLDYLSGPGPFFGPRVDFRWCPAGGTDLGADPAAVDRRLGEAAGNLRALFAPAAGAGAMLSAQDTEARNRNLRSMGDSFTRVRDDLTKINDRFPVIKDELAIFRTNVGELERLLGPVLNPPPEARAPQAQLDSLGVVLYSTRAIAAGDAALERIKNGLVSIGATGIMISFCDPGRLRRFALDGGLSSLHTVSNDKWAGGHTIWLNALTAGVSFRPYSSTNVDHDYFDVGVVGGVYIFSSAGIDSTFSVPVLTPFVDFHAPTKFVYAKGAKYWLSRFTVRAGFVFFTEEIPASKFNGIGQSDIPKAEASRLTFTVYYNLWPKLRPHADRLPEALMSTKPQ